MSHFILEEPKEFDIELHFLKEQLNRNRYVHSYKEVKEPYLVVVEEVDAGEVYKNGQYVTTISCINGHYFEIYWRRDNSEWGEHQFDETPFEVKKVSQLTGYDLNMKPVYTDTWEKV